MIESSSTFAAVKQALPPALAGELMPHATTIRAKAGRTLVSFGATSSSVYLVLEGRVQVALLSLNGHEVILRDLGPGMLFGELAAMDDEPRSASITTVTDCVLASIPGARFRETVCATPAAALWIVQRLAVQVRSLTEKVFELNALRVPSRLHCELLRLCGDDGGVASRAIIDPSPTHAELASRIGTHREAVTREIGYLVQAGIVEQHRRRLTVLDVPALARLVRAAAGDPGGDLTRATAPVAGG